MKPVTGKGIVLRSTLNQAEKLFRSTQLTLIVVVFFHYLLFCQIKQAGADSQKQRGIAEQFVQHGMPVRYPPDASVLDRNKPAYLTDKPSLLTSQQG